MNFSRSPLDECTLQCSGCEVPVVPWPRPVLDHTTVINARIGQSGSERGYEGITGGLSTNLIRKYLLKFNQARVNGGSNYDSLKVAKCLVI